MNRFAAEGFVFSSFESFAPLPTRSHDKGRARRAAAASGDRPRDGDSSTLNDGRMRAVRITAEGHVYKTTSLRAAPVLDIPASTLARAAGSSGAASAGPGTRRGLTVFGQDDRVEITDPNVTPYMAIGQLTFDVADPAAGGAQETYVCTGTLVGTDAVLTAAHCVFDQETNDWVDATAFYPARSLDALGGTVDPYGGFGVVYRTVYSAWSDGSVDDPFPYDIAVLRLAPSASTGASAFDTVGYFMGVLGDVCALPESFAVVGYPGSGGGDMFDSGACSDAQGHYQCGDDMLDTNCDWVGGNSGGPAVTLIDGNAQVMGVVSHHVGPASALSTASSSAWLNGDAYNTLTMMNAAKFADIYTWMTEPVPQA
ncbi:trypsin-like cysteine/serine peptidase domain-containing protein [Tribonema minus]|uniref:Trypsin-like cysteine/serine peptidase domain-containing protein n=1 Tax=Tribonema minus TaxID=303371 RepID=A0A835Z061_9STRA|nr:trypsin-like cysteine/serine peptidase domain-containing protein [Tribonema minus]